MEIVSQKPFLIRAIHEWCSHNGLTPYLLVHVDKSVQVPIEYVRDNEIVLNVSYESTNGLLFGNDYIEFKARFAGRVREIMIPVARVAAIYARENGQGMGFEVQESVLASYADPAKSSPSNIEQTSQAGVVLSLHQGNSTTDSKGMTASLDSEGPNDDEPPPQRPVLRIIK